MFIDPQTFWLTLLWTDILDVMSQEYSQTVNIKNLVICSTIFFKLVHIAISLLNILQNMLSSCGQKDNVTCDNHMTIML